MIKSSLGMKVTRELALLLFFTSLGGNVNRTDFSTFNHSEVLEDCLTTLGLLLALSAWCWCPCCWCNLDSELAGATVVAEAFFRFNFASWSNKAIFPGMLLQAWRVKAFFLVLFWGLCCWGWWRPWPSEGWPSPLTNGGNSPGVIFSALLGFFHGLIHAIFYTAGI